MRFVLLLLLLMVIGLAGRAQYIYNLTADTVKITSTCDSAELIVQNHTQDVQGGFLYNANNGRTVFRRMAVKLNDSLYLMGADTLAFQANGVELFDSSHYATLPWITANRFINNQSGSIQAASFRLKGQQWLTSPITSSANADEFLSIINNTGSHQSAALSAGLYIQSSATSSVYDPTGYFNFNNQGIYILGTSYPSSTIKNWPGLLTTKDTTALIVGSTSLSGSGPDVYFGYGGGYVSYQGYVTLVGLAHISKIASYPRQGGGGDLALLSFAGAYAEDISRTVYITKERLVGIQTRSPAYGLDNVGQLATDTLKLKQPLQGTPNTSSLLVYNASDSSIRTLPRDSWVDTVATAATVTDLTMANISLVTDTTTIDSSYAGTVILDGTNKDMSVYLPGASQSYRSIGDGHGKAILFRFIRKDGSGHNVQIVASSGTTINGLASVLLSGQYQEVVCQINGNNWISL